MILSMTSIARNGLPGVVLLLLAACEQIPAAPERTSPRKEVTFVVEPALFRSDDNSGEEVVRSLDVLVFRSADGIIDAYSRLDAPEGGALRSISADVSVGTALDWWVVANAPEGALSSIVLEESFLEETTLLSDGSTDHLVMHGSGSLPCPQAESVAVSLDRYCCKVTLGEVSVDWDDAFALGSVLLGRVALINVVGSVPYSGVPTAGDPWHNRMGPDGCESAVIRDLTVKDWGGVALSRGIALGVASSLYCMPNPLSAEEDALTEADWSPRCTRLVVELLIGGVPNWYPVTLPGMRGNTHYLINRLTVRGPGADAPDRPVVRTGLDYTVSVTPWEDRTVPVGY
jgi:hypothetical protein